MSAWGGVLVKENEVAEAITDSTPRRITAFDTVMGPRYGFSVASDTSGLAPHVSGEYIVQALGVSFSGSALKEFLLEVYVGDAPTGFQCDRRLNSNGDVGVIGLGGLVSVESGQEIHIRAWSEDGGTSFVLRSGQLCVIKMRERKE